MSFRAVKGTRDFYPDQMRIRNWMCDVWRRVSLRNGFEEYDAPIFEYLELFTAKSGPEIAEQLFSLTDRGGRNLAIRPEITPSLARMINAKINSLPRPIKWFSIPRLCRAENPQKGRLREFFQWNIDVIGEAGELADAECVYVAVDALREMNLTSADVQVRYSSRALLSAVIEQLDMPGPQIPAVMAAMDKRSKVSPEAFNEIFTKAVPSADARSALVRFVELDGILADEPKTIAQEIGIEPGGQFVDSLAQLRGFARRLEEFNLGPWCRYDPSVVRGLAYYTGIVYEVFDAAQSLRAIAGGGRYDNLLEVLGGPAVSATGFGMGDVVLGVLLEGKNLLPPPDSKLDYFVIDTEGVELSGVLAVVDRLRRTGLAVDFAYKRQPTGKQLREANRRRARRVALLKGDGVSVKELATGLQQEFCLEEFLANPPR